MRAAASLRPLLARLGVAALVLGAAGTGIGTQSATAAPRSDPDALRPAATQPRLVATTSDDKASSSALARTPASLRTLTSTKRIPVMIKYDYDAVASYRGTLAGYAATSPAVTSRPLTEDSAATTRYRGYVRGRERSITSRLESTVPSARVLRTYRTVYGGVAAVIPGNTVRELLRVPGVVAVQRNALNHPLTDSSTDFINATAAYRQLHTTARAGKGILFADLDTGVWPEHPSFADRGDLPARTGPALPCDFGDNPLTPADDPFQCTNKLVSGQDFLQTYDQLGVDHEYAGTARDSDGHGSHTSGTAAGDIVQDVQTIGPEIARINGVAPGAQIAEYRVCAQLGCYTSDTTAATEQAILDGAQVINFSISGGTNPLTDATELAFLDAYNAGVFVAASAGNDGPGAGTAEHLSPWVTSVGASTQKREFASQLTLTADNGETFTAEGSTLTAGAGPLPVVSAAAAPYSDAFCGHPAPAGTFTGKIVVCERGGTVAGAPIGRVEKGYNVLQGGAAGMILYNPVLADTETDNHWLPAIHLADGTALVAFLGSHTGITGQWAEGAAKDGRGDVMAAFSSRGPAGSFIKPDIAAPGVQILAAQTPTPEEIAGGPPGQYYQAIAGTSMAAPHIAGAAILIKAVHADWTPGQIKSAMMTQAVTSVVKEDLTTPADAFDMGAGRIDVGRAIAAPLTISDSAANMLALTADPVHSVDLNIPSINAPIMPGRVSTTRVVRNVTGRTLLVRPSARTTGSTRISFRPALALVRPGRSARFGITVSSREPVGTQQFATVRFSTNAGTAHLPVAFVPSQGSVSLTQACDPASVRRGRTTTCTVTATNNAFTEQDVTVQSGTGRRLRITAADGATLRGRRATASTTLAPTTLGVPSVAPGTSPGDGFLDLGELGIAPEPIGDEAQQTYDVPAFTYNGRTETRVSVDSNGYLVVGGDGASEDNECCNLPAGASPARPNNILAPLWTDLNGEGAPGISVGSLTDGTNTWIVVQWDVNVYGTSDTRHFQTWIGVNGTQDITYSYSAPQTDPGQPFLVGAENAAGQGQMAPDLPTGDLRVTSTDPEPGGNLSYELTVLGREVGVGDLHTEMTATGVTGTTVVDTGVPVTR